MVGLTLGTKNVTNDGYHFFLTCMLVKMAVVPS